MTLVPKNKTAWFSSSVTHATVKTWVRLGGIVVKSNASTADFVFAEDSEDEDVQRLFKSKKFLDGHMTVFSPNIIHDIMTKKFNQLDVGKYVVLPVKDFDESGIVVPMLKDDAVAVTDCQDSSNSDEVIVECPLTNNHNNDNDDDDTTGSSKSSRRISKSKDDTLGSSCTRSIFYNSLNFDVVHLDDICVPAVRMMDFKPGVDGCRVVKRRTGTFHNHNS